MKKKKKDKFDGDGKLEAFSIECCDPYSDDPNATFEFRLVLTGEQKESINKGDLSDKEKEQLLPDYIKEILKK